MSKKVEVKWTRAVNKFEVGNVALENAHDYRQLLLSLKYQYFHYSPIITLYLELETTSV